MKETSPWKVVVLFIPVLSVFLLWFFYNINTGVLDYTQESIWLVSIFENSFYYLSLNLFTLSLPLFLSFDKKVAFFKKWKYLFPAIGLTALVFIPWDVTFTHWGVWGFNEKYYIEFFKIFNLPLEEWLFFLTVPYACVFIYECLKCYIKDNPVLKIENILTNIILGVFLLLLIFNINKIYPTTSILLSISLLLYHKWFRDAKDRAWFYLAYIISLLPFFIINGALTGSFTKEPVVVYNNAANFDFRLLTIPADDLIYSFLLLFLCTTLFEIFRMKGE